MRLLWSGKEIKLFEYFVCNVGESQYMVWLCTTVVHIIQFKCVVLMYMIQKTQNIFFARKF